MMFKKDLHIPRLNKKTVLSIIILTLLLLTIPLTFLAIQKANFDIRKRAQSSTTSPITTPPGDPKVTCTVAAFADDSRNAPPVYYEITPITNVEPGQTIVWGIGFTNPSNFDFNFVKNFIFLGTYQKFLDSSSFECPYDINSKSLVCTHGLFLHGGSSSMAIRTQFLGITPIPIETLAASFTNIGTTGACSYSLNQTQI
ncbi:hypothetical protein HZB96_00220, partial [Candidatus Gottesmanbacteria bacterium]|nr:hypothetical protein [Candidatus Gottesmanbacteria bacterium]